MRPIVCVCRLGSRTIRAASPRGPPEERGQLMLLRRVGQCPARDCVFGPACCENVGIVSTKLLKCRRAVSAQCDAITRGIVRVGAHLANQASLEDGLLVGPESVEIGRTSSDSPGVQQNLRFPVQPICAPIGRDVSAMAPDCTNFLSADGLPDALPIGDGTSSEEKLPVRRVHIRDGRSFADHLSAQLLRERRKIQ